MNYKKYYRDKTYYKEESHFKNIFKKRFNIAINFTKKGKVLDIGASTGTMLDIFKENGWETFGVEPSESAKIASQKGHKITKTFFEKTKFSNNYFDLVIMNHTLEHLDNPLIVLQKIHKILKKGGILLVDVPNAGGLASKILKDKWPYKLPEEHKWQFTKKSLTKILKDANYKVIHFESRSGIFEFESPIKEIWESLIQGKKRFFTNIINIPYDLVVTISNSGDSMTIIGKK